MKLTGLARGAQKIIFTSTKTFIEEKFLQYQTLFFIYLEGCLKEEWVAKERLKTKNTEG
jgi:hypothetical protein